MEHTEKGDSRCWLLEGGIVRRLEVSATGCRNTRMPGIELQEDTGEDLLLMDP